MKKLLLALGIIREITLTQRITKKRITKYYFNLYNPIVWIICAIDYLIAIVKFTGEGMKDILSDIKYDAGSEIRDIYEEFKQYEKYKKENSK